MSIWESGFITAEANPVTDLLKQDGGCAVTDLLEEAQLLQEIRGNNDDLMLYLSKEPIISKLIYFAVQNIVDESLEPAEKVKLGNYGYVATQVFNCISYLPSMLDIMTCVTHDASPADTSSGNRLLQQLFSILEEDTSDTVRCGFFLKILSTLIKLRPSSMLFWFHIQGYQLLFRLLNHIQNNSITQVVIDMLQLIDPTNTYIRRLKDTELFNPNYDIQSWWGFENNEIISEKIFKNLFHMSDKVEQTTRKSIHCNASKIINSICSTPSNYIQISGYDPIRQNASYFLFIELTSSHKIIQELTQNIFNSDVMKTARENALKVFNAMVQSSFSLINHNEEKYQPSNLKQLSDVVYNPELVLDYLLKYVNTMQQHLTSSDFEISCSSEIIRSNLQTTSPTFGFYRLGLIHLINSVVMFKPMKEISIVNQLINKLATTETLSVLLNLMSQFPNHNMMLSLISDIICNIIEDGPILLRRELFTSSGILSELLHMNHMNNRHRNHGETVWRKGYMCHITRIANTIIEYVECAKESSDYEIINKIQKNSEWEDFVMGDLLTYNLNNSLPLTNVLPDEFLHS